MVVRPDVPSGVLPGFEVGPARPSDSAGRRRHQTTVRPPALHGSASDDLVSAARGYRELVQGGAVAYLDSWCEHFPGKRTCAELFRDLHRNDPLLAHRLADSLTRLPGPGS